MHARLTDQEEFWQGEFGSKYIQRNNSPELLTSNVNFFAKILGEQLPSIHSVLELGANIGMNYKALKELRPGLDFTGVEINLDAHTELSSLGCKTHLGSLLDFRDSSKFDLVFTKGVLIHINPEQLYRAYDSLYENSKQFILIAEYYNPTPVTLNYRGFTDKLYKRDFAGEFMDRYPDIELFSYGFNYHRGENPQDDITWFLLRK